VTEFSPLDTFREPSGSDDPERSRRIREDFRARIAAMPTDADGRRPFDPPVRRAERTRSVRRHVPALALTGLVIVVAMVALGVARLSPSSAPDGFDQLASAAAERPDATLTSGQYLHVAARTTTGADEVTRQQWTSSDGSGQTVVAALDLRAAGEAPTITPYPAPGSLDFAGLSYEELRSLPAEPSSLVERLRELGVITSTTPSGEASALAEVLALDVTPPDVAAAALRALEQLGGERIGAVPDAIGRVGEGLRGANGDGTSWLVVVDPRTGAAMAMHPKVDPTTPASRVDGRVWTEQGITDHLPGS
jgi:hypothetical protein